jgi:hypothetical protein
VQTFLPYADFRASAAALDNRRLGKQRVEGMQILRAIARSSGGWANHPCTRMWRGYEEALTRYTLDICAEWIGRGFNDTVVGKVLDDYRTLFGGDGVRPQDELAATGELPPWLGDEALHRAYRSLLLRKDPEFYGREFGDVPGDLELVWPVPE